jgi:hypothetical protein
MVHDPLLECTFLIPIHRDVNLSDGKEHDSRVWDWLDDELHNRFGGLTQAPGFHRGSYNDPDTAQRIPDESAKFLVAVATSHVDELRGILSIACLKFQQKCLYLSVAGYVEFIKPP